MMKVTCVLLAVGVLLARPSKAHDGLPWLVVRQFPEYPAPGRTVRYAPGLVIAIWRDGTVLRATDRANIGIAAVRGKLPALQMKGVMMRFNRAWFDRLAKTCEDLVLHASSEAITVRLTETTIRLECSQNVGNDDLDQFNSLLWDLRIKSATAIDLHEAQNVLDFDRTEGGS